MAKRECGACSLCCKVPAVPDLNKPYNTWCDKFAKGRGCSIHSERPQVCRDFECAWLQDERGALPDDFRPDKVHAILTGTMYNDGLSVNVDPAYPNAFRVGAFGRMLELVAEKATVVIVVGRKTYSRLGRQWVAVENVLNDDGVMVVNLPKKG